MRIDVNDKGLGIENGIVNATQKQANIAGFNCKAGFTIPGSHSTHSLSKPLSVKGKYCRKTGLHVNDKVIIHPQGLADSTLVLTQSGDQNASEGILEDKAHGF